MKLRYIITLVLLLLLSCEKELSDYDYIRIQRQKVANALALGVAESFPTEVTEDVDICLDKAGNVRFKGHIDEDALLEKASLLDGTLPRESYRERLKAASACFNVGMYYDGSTNPVAVIVLKEMRLKDTFGEFYAYEIAFRFNNSIEVGVRNFFESEEFYPYRNQLFDFLATVLDVL